MAIVVSNLWTSPVPVSRNRLVQRVSRMYGVDGDDVLDAAALDFLDECVIEANNNLWESSIVYESGLDIVADQTWVQLSEPAFKINLAYFTSSAGEDQPPLTFLDYPTFQRRFPNTTKSGHPTYWSTFNLHQEGKLYLGSMPNSAAADNYDLSVQYYRRLPLISQVGESESVNIPQELNNYLVMGGQRRMAMHVMGPSHPDVGAMWQLEKDALLKARGVDQIEPARNRRFWLPDSRRASTSTAHPIFIKVS